MNEIPKDVLKMLQNIKELADPERNPEQNEAEAAMLKLTQMLRKYNLDIAQLDHLPETEYSITDEVLPQDSMEVWKKQLVYILAKYNGCTVLAYDNPDPGRLTADGFFVIAGKPENIAVVKELYNWLSTDLPKWAYDAWVEAKTAPLPESVGENWETSFFDRISTRRMSQEWVDYQLAWEDPAEWRRSYIIGVIWGWDAKMDAERRTASTQDGAVSSLVVIQDREVKEYIDSKFQTEFTPLRAKAMAHSAYKAGKEKGQSIGTEKQVHGDNAPSIPLTEGR